MVATRLLNMGKTTLWRKMNEYGLFEHDCGSQTETGPDAPQAGDEADSVRAEISEQ